MAALTVFGVSFLPVFATTADFLTAAAGETFALVFLVIGSFFLASSFLGAESELEFVLDTLALFDFLAHACCFGDTAGLASELSESELLESLLDDEDDELLLLLLVDDVSSDVLT